MTDEPWQTPNQPWREAWRWLFVSYIQSFAADWDGPPSWFWPSTLLASVTLIALGGFFGVVILGAMYVRVLGWTVLSVALTWGFEYIKFVLPWYASFCIADIGLWFTYSGWKHHIAKQPAPVVVAAAQTVSTHTETTTEQTTGTPGAAP